MSVVDDVRQAVQDFLAPELRTISARLDATEKVMSARFDAVDTKFQAADVKLDALHKELQGVNEKLDFDRRLAKPEARQASPQQQ